MSLLYYKSVVCRLDACREFSGEFGVAWQLVGEVSEPAVLCSDSFCYLQCCLKTIMRNMMATTYCIDYEVV